MKNYYFQSIDSSINIMDLTNLTGLPSLKMTEIPTSNFVPPTLPDISLEHMASGFYERLAKSIIEFEKKLQPDEEIGLRLVSFGESITIHVDDLGYWNPSLIKFFGFDEKGNEVELIQHVSQISFLLVKLPCDLSKPQRQRVGFKLSQELNQSKFESGQ